MDIIFGVTSLLNISGATYYFKKKYYDIDKSDKNKKILLTAIILILLLIVSIVYSCILIKGRPFENSLENKMSLFTETLVSIYLYLLLCLTDFMGNTNLIRDFLALALVSVIGFSVFVNLIFFTKVIIFRIKAYIENR
jgi:hypothetical protein